MIDYRFQGRLTYIPGGPLDVQMSAWPGFDKTNLIAWWALDETSGTRNDSHTNGYHLTDNNTVGYGTGKQGNAADFERANGEYLSCNDNDDLSGAGEATDFTFACWVWLEATLETDGHGLIIASKWDLEANPNVEWSVYYLRDTGNVTRTRFLIGNSPSAPTLLDVTPGISVNEWHFLVAWTDSEADKAYLQIDNGTPAEISHATGVPNGAAPFRLGSIWEPPNASFYMDGLIDEASFWKRVLTSDERTWLYNSGAGRVYADL